MNEIHVSLVEGNITMSGLITCSYKSHKIKDEIICGKEIAINNPEFVARTLNHSSLIFLFSLIRACE